MYFRNKSELFALLLKSVLRLLSFNYFFKNEIPKKKKQKKPPNPKQNQFDTAALETEIVGCWSQKMGHTLY